MRYRCKAWHEQYPDAGEAGAGTKGLEFLFAAFRRLRSRRRLCRRSAGAAHKRRTALRCLYGESAGTGTGHAAKLPYSAPSVSRRRRAARSGQDRPRGAKALARQRERKHNSPHAQTSPYQGGEEPPGPVRTAPAERRREADSVSENITSPTHKPLRIKAAKSRPVRSGPPPRSGDVSRLREREHNFPHAQPSPYQGGEEPPDPVRVAPAERRPKPLKWRRPTA